MGTYFITAMIASATQKLLLNPNILYFIQDYEAIFFPFNSDNIEVLETYNLPHFAIFSTPFLQDYFKVNRIGVYKGYEAIGESRSYASKPAIKVKPRMDFQMNSTKLLRLAMYARPHKPRNAFEISVVALSEAILQNIVDPNKWEFIGLGAPYSGKICDLGGDKQACLIMMKMSDENEYKKILTSADIGISLMISPHPSLPPLDFAATGIITVTNSFATKTSIGMSAISSNIIAIDPSLLGIVDGIKQAVSKIYDINSRYKGANLNWPKDWNDDRCYGSTLMSKIAMWMKDNNTIPL